MTTNFYDEQLEHSRVKTALVVKYFFAWARIMLPYTDRLGYYDLFSGPGIFEKRERSTPLLLLEQALTLPSIATRLVARFNDANPAFADQLKGEIDRIPGVAALQTVPAVTSREVDDSFCALFDDDPFPKLTFLDPWGYKGLTRKLVKSAVRGFGCEGIFFFNYPRLNAAINNERVAPHVEALLTADAVEDLQRRYRGVTKQQREVAVLRALASALEEDDAPPVIPFRFERPGGQSHYICFVSKHVRGYRIMKEIMASAGIKDSDGVPQFAFTARTESYQLELQIDRPILELPTSLHETFSGRTLTVAEIIDEHNVGTPFISPNYKRVLMEMESRREISCARAPRARRDKMGDKNVVTFPT